VLVLLELLVELDVVLVELEVELEEEVTVEVDELEVVLAAGEYVNVTTCVAVALLPPHVAFTDIVPAVHAAFPPGMEV
jgi:hypothetical protein